MIVSGRRINSCLTLAVMHDGESVTTVEGLAPDGDTLAPIQRAFIEKDAFQCGYCTPGQLCSATALIDEYRAGDASAVTADVRFRPAQLSDDEIRERMSGNICRCGAYPNIVAAVKAVASAQRLKEAHMDAISYQRAADIGAALSAASQPGTMFIGGGTNLLDLMKGGVMRPMKLVDITHIDALNGITALPDGGLRLGALVRNSDAANHALGARALSAACRRRCSRARRRNCATWRRSAAI